MRIMPMETQFLTLLLLLSLLVFGAGVDVDKIGVGVDARLHVSFVSRPNQYVNGYPNVVDLVYPNSNFPSRSFDWSNHWVCFSTQGGVFD